MCRECTKKASAIAYRKRRRYYIAQNNKLRLLRKRQVIKFLLNYFKGHPCVDCGTSDPLVLQFDHVRGKKEREVAVMLSAGSNISHILDELKKCEVRCANCHAIKTARELGYYKYLNV